MAIESNGSRNGSVCTRRGTRRLFARNFTWTRVASILRISTAKLSNKKRERKIGPEHKDCHNCFRQCRKCKSLPEVNLQRLTQAISVTLPTFTSILVPLDFRHDLTYDVYDTVGNSYRRLLRSETKRERERTPMTPRHREPNDRCTSLRLSRTSLFTNCVRFRDHGDHEDRKRASGGARRRRR